MSVQENIVCRFPSRHLGAILFAYPRHGVVIGARLSSAARYACELYVACFLRCRKPPLRSLLRLCTKMKALSVMLCSRSSRKLRQHVMRFQTCRYERSCREQSRIAKMGNRGVRVWAQRNTLGATGRNFRSSASSVNRAKDQFTFGMPVELVWPIAEFQHPGNHIPY